MIEVDIDSFLKDTKAQVEALGYTDVKVETQLDLEDLYLLVTGTCQKKEWYISVRLADELEDRGLVRGLATTKRGLDVLEPAFNTLDKIIEDLRKSGDMHTTALSQMRIDLNNYLDRVETDD